MSEQIWGLLAWIVISGAVVWMVYNQMQIRWGKHDKETSPSVKPKSDGGERKTLQNRIEVLDKSIVSAIIGTVLAIGAFFLLLAYGIVVIILKYAFGVQLWNPFG